MGAALLYTSAMYGYVWMKMRPLPALVPPSSVQSTLRQPSLRLIHAVNSLQRAKAKDKYYDGMEIDISHADGHLVAAHDEKHISAAPALDEIFAVLAHPENKTFWLDLKINLTQQEINELKKSAEKYHIPLQHILFEVAPGPTADLLNANGFPIVLQLPDGFHEDGANPEKRRALNAQLEELLQRYHPLAVVGSFGKYPYLKAYFPKYNKAVYYSTTVRPSLKKYFLSRAMFDDPTVSLWLQDEYTVLPF